MRKEGSMAVWGTAKAKLICKENKYRYKVVVKLKAIECLKDFLCYLFLFHRS